MRDSLRSISFAAAALALTASAVAAPPGDRLLDQVKQAYARTKQYKATATLDIKSKRGRWSVDQRADVPIAYDRTSGQLLIDKPDLYVVVGEKLRLKSDRIPGRHLEKAAPRPLTYQKLMKAAPFLAQPPMVDVAFLLSKNPVSAMSRGQANSATPMGGASADGGGPPRLRFKSTAATYTLTVDPKTKLIRRAVINVDASHYGGAAGDKVQFAYDYHIKKRNQSIQKGTFSFQTNNSKAVSSLTALMQPAGGQGSGGGGAQQALVGKPAPPVNLAMLRGGKFDSSKVRAKVVVLDFWATWCPPCRKALPQIQGVANWAKKQNKSVRVYAVNVGETAGDVKSYWKQNGFTMPVLMDKQGKATAAYGAQAIPQTVVIADGKVRHVHMGYSPDEGETLKSEITKLLQSEASQQSATR